MKHQVKAVEESNHFELEDVEVGDAKASLTLTSSGKKLYFAIKPNGKFETQGVGIIVHEDGQLEFYRANKTIETLQWSGDGNLFFSDQATWEGSSNKPFKLELGIKQLLDGGWENSGGSIPKVKRDRQVRSPNGTRRYALKPREARPGVDR